MNIVSFLVSMVVGAVLMELIWILNGWQNKK